MSWQMENLPESLFVDPVEAGWSPSRGGVNRLSPHLQSASVDELIMLLRDPRYREDVISLLSKKGETFRDLALLLWNSFHTIFILLEEVLNIYKSLTPSKLTRQDSIHVCNVLALYQCVASHRDTRIPFIKARIPAYLYPFLSSTETELPFELLRINSLGVIDALIKDDDPQVIHFLLESEIFPLCLRCMELGHETSKQVAALTVSKILQQQQGLYYCGAFVDRFYAVAHVLRRVVDNLPGNPRPPLLRNIVRCYLLLTKMPRASGALRRCFPARLIDGTFTNILREDPQTMRHLQHLLYKVNLGQDQTRG